MHNVDFHVRWIWYHDHFWIVLTDLSSQIGVSDSRVDFRLTIENVEDVSL